LDGYFVSTEVQNPEVARAQADYFSVFGLSRKLNIDLARLEKEFYRMSRKLHPDLYVNRPAAEQERALEMSSRLNDAYRTLKDPVARTQYLLSLEGVQLEEQSKAATDRARVTGEEKKQIVPPDLLEEVFELNMQLQELKASGGQDPEARGQLETAKKNFEARLETLSSELRQRWNEWDAVVERNGNPDSTERRKVRDAMVDLLNRRSYIRNLVRDVNEALK
jgi:molecular chaperone HscB